jgi:hypothetical protein
MPAVSLLPPLPPQWRWLLLSAVLELKQTFLPLARQVDWEWPTLLSDLILIPPQ